jgi:hypothetical protein
MQGGAMKEALLWWIAMMLSIIAAEMNEANANLELIALRIQEANMTYEEYCEYYPEECEELF